MIKLDLLDEIKSALTSGDEAYLKRLKATVDRVNSSPKLKEDFSGSMLVSFQGAVAQVIGKGKSVTERCLNADIPLVPDEEYILRDNILTKMAFNVAANEYASPKLLSSFIEKIESHENVTEKDKKDIRQAMLAGAVRAKSLESIGFMIEDAGADPNGNATKAVSESYPILHIAAFRDRDMMFHLIEKYHVDPNAVDRFTGWTVLSELEKIDANVIRRLHSNGFDFSPKAEGRSYSPLCEILKNHDAWSGSAPILAARNIQEIVETAMELGADVSQPSPRDGSLPLHLAAELCVNESRFPFDTTLFDTLSKGGELINQTDKSQKTALHRVFDMEKCNVWQREQVRDDPSFFQPKQQFLEYAISRGADVNLSSDGVPPASVQVHYFGYVYGREDFMDSMKAAPGFDKTRFEEEKKKLDFKYYEVDKSIEEIYQASDPDYWGCSELDTLIEKIDSMSPDSEIGMNRQTMDI